MNKRQMKKRYMGRKSDYRITLAVIRKMKNKKIIKREERKIMLMLRKSKKINPACKGYGLGIGICEYFSIGICKNPHAKTPVVTSILYGDCPSICPKKCDWNYKE